MSTIEDQAVQCWTTVTVPATQLEPERPRSHQPHPSHPAAAADGGGHGALPPPSSPSAPSSPAKSRGGERFVSHCVGGLLPARRYQLQLRVFRMVSGWSPAGPTAEVRSNCTITH